MIAAPLPAECGVVEVRRYTLHPGRRDELIELFEREFVQSQEHRNPADATMIDSTDVLLVQPTFHTAARTLDDERLVHVLIADVADLDAADRAAVLPPTEHTLARFESLRVDDDFPRLPVRDVDVVVSIMDATGDRSNPNDTSLATLVRTRRTR